MLSAATARGFTVVELLVGLTIAALLVGLGAPSIAQYLQNSRISNSTQSLHAGLTAARTEAIRRNALVQFMMTDSSVSASDAASSAAPSASGASWLVRAPRDDGTGTYDIVEAKAGGEGTGTPAAAVRVAVSSSAAFAGIITFNGLGGTQDSSAYIFDLTSPSAGACADAGGPMRCKRIRVAAGGQMFTCDPAVTAVDDNRFCR